MVVLLLLHVNWPLFILHLLAGIFSLFFLTFNFFTFSSNREVDILIPQISIKFVNDAPSTFLFYQIEFLRRRLLCGLFTGRVRPCALPVGRGFRLMVLLAFYVVFVGCYFISHHVLILIPPSHVTLKFHFI